MSIWKVRRVLAQRGHEALGHPLVLEAQRVDDVGLAEPVERVGDLAAELLDPARDQGRRAADGDLRAHRWKAIRFERATRLWRTSPTIQIRTPSRSPRRRRNV